MEFMENKKEIIEKLKDLLVTTRAGCDIEDLIYSKEKETVTILFHNGTKKIANIAYESGYAIILDVMKVLQKAL